LKFLSGFTDLLHLTLKYGAITSYRTFNQISSQVEIQTTYIIYILYFILSYKYAFEEVDTRGGNHDEMKPGFCSNQRGKAFYQVLI